MAPAGFDVRAASAGDDEVVTFRTLRSRTQGPIVRLGASVDEILTRHAYPLPVSEALGQAMTLTAMLGTVIRAGGKLILQTTTDGPLRMLAVNYYSPSAMRGLASFDEACVAALGAGARDQSRLLGNGHFAMTIDNGGDEVRYQGIVPLAGQDLIGAAHAYFQQSEQIPTFIRLAVARHSVPAGAGGDRAWHWRAGGLMVQQLPSDVGHFGADQLQEDGYEPLGDVEEEWSRIRALSETIEDHELTDPTLSSQELLWRLFHEEGVMAGTPAPIRASCSCSRERVETVLKGFSASELAELYEPDGSVAVTCEYCNRKYRFTPEEAAGLGRSG